MVPPKPTKELLEHLKEPPSTDVFAHDDPRLDWEARKAGQKLPFDVVVLCQDPRWAETVLLIDHDAEPAGVDAQERLLFRLPDGRFAVMANRIEVMDGAPLELDFWNWWTQYAVPSFKDFRESEEIEARLAHRQKQRT